MACCELGTGKIDQGNAIPVPSSCARPAIRCSARWRITFLMKKAKVDSWTAGELSGDGICMLVAWHGMPVDAQAG